MPPELADVPAEPKAPVCNEFGPFARPRPLPTLLKRATSQFGGSLRAVRHRFINPTRRLPAPLRALVMILGSLAVLAGVSLAASPQAAAQEEPEKVFVGVFVNDIYDLALTSNSFNADIYVWLRWSNPDIDPSASFEVMNPFGFDGVVVERLHAEPEDMPDGSKYMAFRIRGLWISKMNLRKYPFDVQNLLLQFEDGANDASKIQFVPDKTPVAIDASISLPGFVIDPPTLAVRNYEYPTDFGDLAAGSPDYSRVTVTIPVEREVLPLAIKIMLPVTIIILLTALIYVIPARLEEARTGIAVTAMLTLMALQWTVTSNLPEVGYLMMIDVVYILSMVYILIAMVYTVIGSRRSVHEQAEESLLRVDRQVGVASLAVYAVLVVLTVLLYLR